MADYAETVRRHRRLAILRHLEASAEYIANSSILTDVLRDLGVQSTYDQVVTELAWLKEQGLVKTEGEKGFLVAQATTRGVELALGIATHPDVQRPRPRG